MSAFSFLSSLKASSAIFVRLIVSFSETIDGPKMETSSDLTGLFGSVKLLAIVSELIVTAPNSPKMESAVDFPDPMEPVIPINVLFGASATGL